VAGRRDILLRWEFREKLKYNCEFVRTAKTSEVIGTNVLISWRGN
jgi:hypothetical protein